MKELVEMSEYELLQTHGAVIDELLRRKVVTTRDNPIGGYTEWLVCGRLGLNRQPNSKKGFDAVKVNSDGTEIRYQIKGRREESNSVQFSAIRKIEERGFDFLIAVAYHCDYSVRFAVQLPHEVVRRIVSFQEHTNGNNLVLSESIVDRDGVIDIRPLIEGMRAQLASPSNMSSPRIAIAEEARSEAVHTTVAGAVRLQTIWPKSISIRRNLIGSGKVRQFEFKGVRYEVPHDELVRIVGEVTPWLHSPSWVDHGGYSTSNPSAALLNRLLPFALNFSG